VHSIDFMETTVNMTALPPMLPATLNSLLTWEVLFGALAAATVLWVTFTGFSTFAAIAQMGSIQERAMPWAGRSRKSAAAAAAASATAAPATATERKADTPQRGRGKREKTPDGRGASQTAVATRSRDDVDDAADEQATEEEVLKAARRKREQEKALEEIQTHDKIVYTLSVANVAFTAFLLGHAPHWFYVYHTPKAVLYISHRWWTFRQQNQHYLLFDFCYWANALLLYYCWWNPSETWLFRVVFMTSNGPLAWAVLAFGQSMIFHSAPHMTSVFIHVSPMLLTYALRWYPSRFSVCADWPTCTAEPETGVLPMVLETHTSFYLPWVIAYYVWVFVLMNNRIKERGYKTLFDRVSNRGPTKFLTKISRNEYVQKAAYMLVHVAFATVTMLLATAYWRSHTAHFLFIVAILATSAWNAAGFYFTVFANRYVEELHEQATKLTK